MCLSPTNQDGWRGGWGGAGQTASGAEDDGPEKNLHQVDEQCFLQERGENVQTPTDMPHG